MKKRVSKLNHMLTFRAATHWGQMTWTLMRIAAWVSFKGRQAFKIASRVMKIIYSTPKLNQIDPVQQLQVFSENGQMVAKVRFYVCSCVLSWYQSYRSSCTNCAFPFGADLTPTHVLTHLPVTMTHGSDTWLVAHTDGRWLGTNITTYRPDPGL